LINKNIIDYSIVIPVFNAQNTLPQLYDELIVNMEQLDAAFEILFVDDCSRDTSWDTITELAASDPRVCGLLLMRNSGQGAATMAGFAHARGGIVVTLDDDLQNPPYEIPRLLKFMQEHPGIDVVFGRPHQKQHNVWRRIGSTLVNYISNLMFEQPSGFKLTSFRVMRREVVEPLLRLNVIEPAIGALLTTLTKRLANVDVDHRPRVEGRSGYSVSKLLRATITKFLGFSTFPLRFIATIGMLGIAFSIVLGVIVFFRYILGNITVPGWTTLSLLLVGLSGFTFLAFGIIGEYVQQILISVRRTPTFVVRSTYDTVSPTSVVPPGPEVAKITPEKE
jgi:dolichol-phosphate mannosyltransferase/undecaprenyl-phosphate 4-deoxy-4-formamido-L-arabinose transferase